MSRDIPLRCWCGGEIKVDPGGKPRRCEKCRTLAMALETKAVFYIRADGEWVEAETACDGCGRPLLHEQVAQAWEDVQFCEKCKWSEEQLAKLRAEEGSKASGPAE